jgi:sugar lactone lactonase YvrE
MLTARRSKLTAPWLLLLVLALAAPTALGQTEPDPYDPTDPDPSAGEDTEHPDTGDFGAVINTVDYPRGIANVNGLAWSEDEEVLWVVNPDRKRIFKLDPVTGAILFEFPVATGGFPSDATWDGTSLWYGDFGLNTIYQLDPATGSVLSTFTPPGPPNKTEGLTWDGTHLWMGNRGDRNLYRTDRSGNVISSCPAPRVARGADGLAYDHTNGWLYLIGYNNRLYRIDPSECTILEGPARVYDLSNGAAFDGTFLWDSENRDTLFRQYDVLTPTGDTAGLPLPQVSEEAKGLASSALTGTSVAGAGDLDPSPLDQSFQDVIAGSPGFADTANGVPVEAGAATVYLGADNAADRISPDIIFTGEAAHDRAGIAVAGNFDFNGDGIPDLLIGAEQVDRTVDPPVVTGPGKTYLIFFDPTDSTHYPNLGDPSTSDTVSLSLVGAAGGIPGVVFTGVASGDQAGFSVAGGGLVNADNLQDIAIGAPGVDTTNGADAGSVYVIFGSNALNGTISLGRVANGMGDQIDGVIYEGEAGGDALGFSVAFPGDVVVPSGDDIAMGAPFNDPIPPSDSTPLTDAGSAYLGAGGGLTAGIIEVCDIGGGGGGARIQGDQAGMNLGWAVGGGGDNLANGSPDFLVGAPNYDYDTGVDDIFTDSGLSAQTAGRLAAGIIEVCDIGGGGGSTDGTTVEGALWVGVEPGGQLGFAVAGVGDVTEDGNDDITLGAPFTDPNGVADAGTVYLAESTPDPGDSFTLGIIEVCDLGGGKAGRQLNGIQPGEQAGASVAGTSDVSGDSTNDFATGSPGKDQGTETDAGAVSLVLESLGLAQVTNSPPVADASATATLAECDGGLAANVLLDGSLSTDPDSTPGTNDDIVLFEWFENSSTIATGEQQTVSLSLGAHAITLQVTDSAGATDSDGVNVTVQDTVNPGGGITAPADGLCTPLPVTVMDDFSDVCDATLTRSYVPPPGPTYSSHGDYNVTLTVTDDAGNQASDGVSFTIDQVDPLVTILNPPTMQAHIEDDLPLDIVFNATDDDGATGGVVHEIIYIDGCAVYDGLTFGDGDGLLQDETVRLSRAELCRIADQCGFTSLNEPMLRVGATDCAGNLGTDTVFFAGSVSLKPGLCSTIATTVHDPGDTYTEWDAHAGVFHFDVVRGDMDALGFNAEGKVDLGAITCIEPQSLDLTTQGGFEDGAVPEPGKAFFYVIQSFDGNVESSYGYGSDSKKRIVQAGNGSCH